jgi:hypothetical protein
MTLKKLVALEKLNRPLMFFCCFAGLESAEVPSSARFGILFTGIQPKLTG